MTINNTAPSSLARGTRFGACLLALVIAGCSKTGPQLALVEGTVLLDGQPLQNAEVEFQPAKGSPSIGSTGVDGKYKLRFSRDKWGAEVGKHKVQITTFSPEGEGKFKERVPARYNTATELSFEVLPGPNWRDFDLRTEAQTAQNSQ
ncbi:MAG: carboxypeptidase regulatory-like domain-containing protein [Candidatus Saccharimonas sp.]|nr:carboxypeptidase regulatory-like domain-containing protein [Planctomycetaceae bacterium]